MRLLHSEEHVEKLRSTSKMSEDELKEISQQYDYIYFHPVSNAGFSLKAQLHSYQSQLYFQYLSQEYFYVIHSSPNFFPVNLQHSSCENVF